MKNYVLYFVLFFILAVSCSPSRKAKNNFESFKDFISGIESGCKNYTEKDWSSADSSLKIYQSFFDNNNLELLTAEERSEYNILIGRYNGIRTGSMTRKILDNIRDNVTDLGNRAKGFTEGFVKTIDSSISK
jgi:hypothetical protein